MREIETHEDAVRRVLRRDDLLTLAAAADRAVGIVRQRDLEARRGTAGATLFDLALERQVALAEGDRRWAIRAQAWDHAAVLVRYCALVGTELVSTYTAAEMHARALRELEEHGGPPGVRRLDKDLTLGVFNRYHAARDLRLDGRHQEALDLARRSPQDLFGTGAEPHIAHCLYEVGAGFIERGGARQVRGQLDELEGYWHDTRAKGFSTHYRYEFVRALAAWAARPGDPRARRHFEDSMRLLGIDPAGEDVTAHDGEDHRGVRELSVLLAAAEYLAATGDGADRATATDLAARALEVADEVRARWRVIARSRAPLAEVFHRMYGDIALLAHRIGDERAARLGLRAALSAKSTGFATRIRDGLTFDGNPLVDNLLTQIVEIENPEPGPMTDTPQSRREQLEALREELVDAVSPMLADTVFPPPADVAELIAKIGPRYALDYVELRDSLDRTAFFRTLIEPGGRMAFDRFDPGEDFRTLVEQGTRIGDLVRALRDIDLDSMPGLADEGGVDFRGLARDVLPARLTEEILPAAGPDAPVRLLVSAHSWLSLVPWAALRVDDASTRLVQRAVISQCPVLTCLSGDLPPRVEGDALIRLVGRDERVSVYGEQLRGVHVAQERDAWGLGLSDDGVRLSSGRLRADAVPQRHEGRFDDALRERDRWQFLHIATHGGGKGFDQLLGIPGEPLSAARALGLRWPASVLMASCHVGLVLNDHGSEPLSLVMALLTGGARCVVAGIDSVDDASTGRVAAAMVRSARSLHLPLDVALRNAQLAEIAAGTPASGWALLSAYVQ
ncbi:CHAT domain-containing protein [Dactylosporangium sp. CA-139066]|uniref:CHAT domain-containing protein n=1 Tax=Dactylosporangium sp. CA-139066 TaxID=3239930 RepID=UPI003D8F94BC